MVTASTEAPPDCVEKTSYFGSSSLKTQRTNRTPATRITSVTVIPTGDRIFSTRSRIIPMCLYLSCWLNEWLQIASSAGRYLTACRLCVKSAWRRIQKDWMVLWPSFWPIKKPGQSPGFISPDTLSAFLLGGQHPLMALEHRVDFRLTLCLQRWSSRSFNFLLVAVRWITTANNNQRHHQYAYNAEQLLHKEPPDWTLKSYS